MKNFLKHALFVLCVFSMVFGFVGCPKEPPVPGPDVSDPVVSISIAATGYEAGAFLAGDEAKLTATVANSDKNVIWTVEPAGIVSVAPSLGKEVTMVALDKGTATVTATLVGTDKKATFPVVVDVDPATAELTSLPWSVTMGKGFGNNDVFTKSIDDAGHGTWYTNNSLIPWDGIGYFGAANGYQYYAEYEGVWFNWYASANTEIGNIAGGRLESYMALLKNSLNASEGKNVKITINAKAILKAENEGDEPLQPRLAIYTQNKYVLADTDLTEEAKDYEFVVAPGQQICIGNNGPTGSYMVILGVSAEETDAEAIDQTPSINSVTVTLPAEVQVGGTTSAAAAVSVKFDADKTVTWTSSDEAVATVDANGNVTGVAAGTATITATSTVDASKADSKEIAVISGELKPQVGETYVYSFVMNPITEGAINLFESFSANSGNAGESPDTFISWDEYCLYHSSNGDAGSYGINTTKMDTDGDGKGDTVAGTVKIKVAGDSIISWAGSAAYGGGIIDVLDAEGNVIYDDISSQAVSGELKYGSGFIYKGKATTLTLQAVAGTVYFTEFTIKPWTDEAPAVTAIEIQGAGATTVGNTVALKAIVSADYYADSSVTWSSSDDAIATVDANGNVTGVAAGTATITATSNFDATQIATKDVKVAADEAAPIYGYTYSYDLTGGVGTPYASEDSFLKVTANSDNKSHGLVMKDGNTAVLKVAGAGTVSLLLCQYDKAATVTLTSSDGTVIETKESLTGGACNGAIDFAYTGNADTLTFTWSAGTGGHYLHGIKFTPAVTETTYTLTGYVGTPYASDDGLLKITANGDNGGHGLIMKDKSTIEIKVAGASTLSLLLCQYDNSASVTLTASDGTVIETKDGITGGACNAAVDFVYTGDADTLTLSWTNGKGGHYLHGFKVTY